MPGPLRIALLAGLGALAAVAAVSWRNRPPPAGVHLSADGQEITVSGPFAAPLDRRFRQVLDLAPRARLVRLHSPGGSLAVAGNIRNDIRDRHMDTLVTTHCASACTVAFLAGERRVIAPGARLGFHRFTIAGRETGQADSYLLRYYWVAGIAQDFIDRAVATPASSMWYPTTTELRAANIVTEVLTPKSWW